MADGYEIVDKLEFHPISVDVGKVMGQIQRKLKDDYKITVGPVLIGDADYGFVVRHSNRMDGGFDLGFELIFKSIGKIGNKKLPIAIESGSIDVNQIKNSIIEVIEEVISPHKYFVLEEKDQFFRTGFRHKTNKNVYNIELYITYHGGFGKIYVLKKNDSDEYSFEYIENSEARKMNMTEIERYLDNGRKIVMGRYIKLRNERPQEGPLTCYIDAVDQIHSENLVAIYNGKIRKGELNRPWYK